MEGLVFPSSMEQIGLDHFGADLPRMEGLFAVQSKQKIRRRTRQFGRFRAFGHTLSLLQGIGERCLGPRSWIIRTA